VYGAFAGLMLGKQFGIMLTDANTSHLSGCHPTRLHTRWHWPADIGYVSNGSNADIASAELMPALQPKADIRRAFRDVCKVPIGDIEDLPRPAVRRK
jgi:hypothetical protein